MSHICKVNYLIGDNKINEIRVFYGMDTRVNNISELFNKVKDDYEKKVFDDPISQRTIFNKEELENIRNENIKVIFSSQVIHYDDTIGTIKLKLINEFSETFSLEEIYMFCLKEEILNPLSVYKILTQNNKLKLTKLRLDQFLLNIIRDENGNIAKFDLPEKEVYTYDDIVELNLENKKWWVSKVLGQKFFIVENEYPFISNPFDVTEYDDFIERVSRKSLTTLNNQLLLNNGSIIGNNIYLCLAQDVLKNGNNELYSIKIYYPFLNEENIQSLNELENKQRYLIENSKKLLTENTINNFKSVSMFYDIYKERKDELNYIKKGIKFIKFLLKPIYNLKIPLDIIFKIIHAREGNPLIKYNPAARRENVYRLYTDKIAKDGRKIPYLTKASIFKLMQNIGKTKSVAVYIDYEFNKKNYSLICEFEENGNINVSCEFDTIVDLNYVDELFKLSINPIISEVKNYLEQSGYMVIQLFKGLWDESVFVKQINYQSIIQISKPIKLDTIIGCVSNIFIVESSNLKNGIDMRYKRVSNFNKKTSQEAYIIEKQNMPGGEIIKGLVENYDISQTEAVDLLAKMASELQVERGVRGSDIEIKINPGFKTTIRIIPNTTNILIEVENINDINYLKIIPIYLDTIIRLTQDKESTNVLQKTIKLLCSRKKREEVIIEDIISSSEKAFPEQEFPLIEGDEMTFQDFDEYQNLDGKMKNVLDLLYGDEEENYESDNESNINISSGGKMSSSSSSSVSDESEKSLSSLASESKSESDKSLSSLPSESVKESEKSLSSLPSESVKESDKSLSSLPSESVKESDKSLSSFELSDIQGLENLEKPEEITLGSIQGLEKLNEEVKPDEEEKLIEIEPQEEEKKISEEKVIERVVPKKNIVKNIVKKKLIIENDKEEDEVKNIDGMKLKNPTPFFKDMIERDPTLFLTEDTGKFKSYSRTCPSSNRRQPIILSEDEKRKIDKEMPGFLKEEDVIKYGSTSENQNYYVCPRYWCLKTNMPISPEDVKAGKCGKIIPRDEKKVPPGAYVYEFFDPSEHGTQENYVQHYPGFVNDQKIPKHPNGLCIPCCYKKNTESQIAMRNKCIKKIEEKKDEGKDEKEKIDKERVQEIVKDVKKKKVEKEDEYIKGPEKFPLDNGRWGYLPFGIQKLLREVNVDCQISKTNTNIKPFHTCLLRHGVEISDKQSFIACITNAKFFDNTKNIPTIKEMKQIIINAINIDTFITYQNGNLIQSFGDDNNNINVNINPYKSSKLYGKIKKEEDEIFFKKIVVSFENFVSFLKDDNVLIDYTYLWDIICKPNPKIFPQGINLVILEIMDNDTTNNISLICPTNHYSNEFYEARKKTLLLLRKGDYFEPIYSYRNEETKLKIDRMFSEYDPKLSETMRDVFTKLIKPIIKNKCLPLSSMPNEYKFKRPILLYTLIENINKLKYRVIKQAINFNNKVIGLLIENTKNELGFVPCYPSSIDPTYDYSFIDNDNSLFHSYNQTISFLKNLNIQSKGLIPCNPEFKIIEDDHVIGILTETNQFIEINQPVPLLQINDNIKVFNSNNYFIAEKELLTSDKVDTQRVEYITKIKLETNFFNVFRNTIRILLNDPNQITLREKIEKETNEQYILYNEKLKNVISHLKELIGNNVIFSDNYDYTLINEITTCIVSPLDKCNSNPLCAVTNENNCQLILPKINLLNGSNNEIFYLGKMADELIRYNRINSFIFQPQVSRFVSFDDLGYNLKEDEIIIIQSLLNQEYFEGLEIQETNTFIKYNTYDNAEPIKGQKYDNEVNIEEIIYPEELNECAIVDKKEISSEVWKNCFPSTFGEYEYGKTKYCGFYFISDILKKINGINVTPLEIRQILYNEYLKYIPTHKDKILDILIDEGKKTLGDQVKSNSIQFLSFIYSESYFLTNFDIWLLLNKYKISSFFISSKPILLTNNLYKEFNCYSTSNNDKFIFIVTTPTGPEKIPNYKLIKSSVNEYSFLLSNLRNENCTRSLNEAIERKITIEEYLNKYTKNVKKQYTRKQKLPMNYIILDDNEEKVSIPVPVQKSKIILKKNKTRKNKKILQIIED